MAPPRYVYNAPAGTVRRKPGEWVERFAPLVPADGPVLDLACGEGRHTMFFLDRGHPVLAVDQVTEGVEDLASRPGAEILRADLENGNPWPLEGRRFAGIVVTNYLHRPLFPHILAALEEGGVLLYQTLALGHTRKGRPSNPEFLLAPGELLDIVGGELSVVAFEQGRVGENKQAVTQRICAIRKPPGQAMDDIPLHPDPDFGAP